MGALFPQTVKANPIVILDNTDGNVEATLCTGALAGTKVFSIMAFNTDITDNEVYVRLVNGADSAIIAKVAIPAGTAVALLSVTETPGLSSDRSLLLGTGVKVNVNASNLPASAATIEITCELADY